MVKFKLSSAFLLQPTASKIAFKLEHEVRDNIVNHGGRFIDILGDYRRIPDPERDYFPVDGHPDSDGHAMISRFLARELTGGAVPELKASTAPDIAMKP